MMCTQESILLYLQYTIAMMGYGPEDKSAVMELTYNYDVTEYDKGNAYAQVLSFSVSSSSATFTLLYVKGIALTSE